MRIVSTTNVYAQNNANYIIKTVTLTEQFGLYTVGAYCYGDTSAEDFSENYGCSRYFKEAIKIYKENGGKFHCENGKNSK